MAITTGKELAEAIMEGVSFDIAEMPRGQTANWFPPTPTAQVPYPGPTVFRSGEAVPFDQFSIVCGIFHDDEVIRIYTLPKAPPNPKPESWISRAPSRYVLTKAAPTFVSEVMTLDTMAVEMINEWVQVSDGITSAEAEREAVIAHLETFRAEMPTTFGEIIQDLRDEVHLEEDDDEPEDDEPEDGETVGVGAAPAPSVEPPAQPATPAAT